MMDLYSIYICIIIALLHISGCTGNKRNAPRSVRVTYTPKRLRSFETSVKLTFRFGRNQNQEKSTEQVIKLKVFNRKKFVTAINKTLSVNQTQLEISCEVFATPGRYFIEYFIEGLTKTFILLTPRPIISRSEKVHIEVQKNHTAFDGSVSAWLNSKHGRCKPFRGKLKLYWIKSSKEHVLVATKKINKDKLESRTRVHFRCNLFDTAGIFYFVYISDYNNKTIARSHNMSVTWGKYEITAQSKNIFPCSNSFVIKFSSPYCDRTEDKIEMRSKAYNNLIDSQSAYHGFRSVFFSCAVFKKHIRDYCFYYTTKSSLSNERKIQATLCVPSKKRAEPRWTEWTEWSAWSSCTPLDGCGNGRKYRLRFCPLENYHFQNSHDTSPCTGKGIESMPCPLPPCKECKSCGCVFSTPGGTIVSPKSRLPFITKELSSCHWFIEIAERKKVKLWFDSLKLAKNSSVVIRDGNSSNSEILKIITYESQKQIEDIYSTSNVISIWYSNNGKFNLRNNSGFELSYASIDKSQTPVSEISTSSQSGTRRLAKMTFIGILAILIVITFTIVAIIIVRIRRQRSNENAAKTALSQRPSSSHTSTACMSESTMRSFYEPQFSADESVNNNSSLSGVNNNHRARLSTRIEHRAPVHVCPKCCSHVEHHSCEYSNSCHTDGRRILYTHYGQSIGRVQRVHSIIERRLSGASSVSEEDFPDRNYPTYL